MCARDERLAPAARRAIIDVGTNSVKLLVADVTGASVAPVHEESRQTRLGQGFYDTNVLRQEAIEATARVVAEFVERGLKYGAERVGVVATSAARDARNGAQLAEAVRAKSGVELRIISGEQEAAWAFSGISSDPRLAGRPMVIMDAGGGSTQLIWHAGTGRDSRHSFAIGAVRLLEHFPPGDPPLRGELEACRGWLEEFLRNHTPAEFQAIEQTAPRPVFVGTGGSSSLLAAMHVGLGHFDRERLESVVLSRADISRRLESLWGLSLAERKRVPGLPANKADVILMGAAIHEAVMSRFSLEALRISTRGFRFGALLAPFWNVRRDPA